MSRIEVFDPEGQVPASLQFRLGQHVNFCEIHSFDRGSYTPKASRFCTVSGLKAQGSYLDLFG